MSTIKEQNSPEELKQIENTIRDDIAFFKQNNVSFIERMKENKDFQNPKLLEQTIDYFGIDGNGTQFDPSVSPLPTKQ